MRRRHRDKGWLYEKYWGEGLSSREVGRLAGVTGSTIRRAMRDLGVPRRQPVKDGPHRDPEWLREKYHGEGLSMQEIGGLAGVSSATILERMRQAGIETRDKADLGRLVPEDDLRRMYEDEGMTMREIADEVGASTQAISTRMNRWGIEARRTGPRGTAGEDPEPEAQPEEGAPETEAQPEEGAGGLLGLGEELLGGHVSTAEQDAGGRRR